MLICCRKGNYIYRIFYQRLKTLEKNIEFDSKVYSQALMCVSVLVQNPGF